MSESEKTNVEPSTYVSSLDVESEKQRPRLLAITFCDLANLTKEDKVNLIGVFDRIYLPPEQKKTPSFTLYIRTAETDEDELFVHCFNPEKKLQFAFKFGGPQLVNANERKEGRPKQLQLTLNIAFDVDLDGVYWFDVSYKGKSIGGAGLVCEHREGAESGGTDAFI